MLNDGWDVFKDPLVPKQCNPILITGGLHGPVLIDT